MREKLDDHSCQFAAAILLQHINALLAEFEGVREAKDIEYIHRMRVASRRLRTAMSLFGGCLPDKKSEAWTRQIRQVTRSLGSARDTDVQIEWLVGFSSHQTDPKVTLGIQRLILRLTQRRRRLQTSVVVVLNKLTASGTLSDMKKRLTPPPDSENTPLAYSSQLYRYARDTILENLNAMLAFEEIVHFPEKVSELHAMRIAAKKLRYTIEAFQQLYPDDLKKTLNIIRSAQEQLGNIHDCDVWLLFLPEFIKEETTRMVEYLGNSRGMYRYTYGIHVLEQERQNARNQQYDQFVKDWDSWKKKGVWENLVRLVEAPVLNIAAIYPPPGEMPGRNVE
jgi:CHAD domain-containing protein